MSTTPRTAALQRGFSLVDMMMTVAVIGTLAAVAVPQVNSALDSMRLGMALRDVERELQFARLKAVSSSRPMRVRFDCPSAGQVRVVELLGTTSVPDVNDADTAAVGAVRCNETTYPYRPTGSDISRLTRPNNDGPVRLLYPSTTFTAKKTLEFWPDGSVHADAGTGNPWPNVGSPGVTITLARKGKTKNIQVNGLGKIILDR
jgi:prepilin-type N-terminal cleavage/methylation domain-containing protein